MTTQQPFFDLVFWQNFVSNGLATLIGAFVGIFLAEMANNIREQRALDGRKRKVLTGLISELNINYRILSGWDKDGRSSDAADFLGYNINIEVWRAFSDGGELECIKDASVLQNIANAYFCLQAIKQISSDLQQAKIMGIMRSTNTFHDLYVSKLGIAVNNFFKVAKSLREIDIYIYPEAAFAYADDRHWWEY